jgi:septum formation protein
LSAPPLILASGSPRRRQLLERLGLRFAVVPADVDESVLPGEAGPEHVERLALAKAGAVAEGRPDALVIGGDTVVTLDGEILTKPSDPEDAVRMLMRLEGRDHRVETGVAVVHGPRSASGVVGADVRFNRFDRETAEAYVATGEPLDKAGAYGIQGLGSVLVDSIRGDFFAVMGLPVSGLMALLSELGWRYDFRELVGTENR